MRFIALRANTSSRSTPGQLRSSSAPSSFSPSTRIVPSKATRARDKRQRAPLPYQFERRRFGLNGLRPSIWPILTIQAPIDFCF